MNQPSTPSAPGCCPRTAPAPAQTPAPEAEDRRKGYIHGFKWDPSKPLLIGSKGFRIVETDRGDEK